MSTKIFSIALVVVVLIMAYGFRDNDRKASRVDFQANYNPGSFCGSNFNLALLRSDSNIQKAPLFSEMGQHGYQIHTINPLAQQYFNQGLNLIYGFNHGEAYRSFQECLKLDPLCTMAYWGIAMSLGPNINDWVPSKEREQEAFEALTTAKLMLKVGKELDMILALSSRHADSTALDRDTLNLLYSSAMQNLSKKYPDDLEIKTLSADAMMNAMPWDYYEKDLSPKPATVDVVSILEEVIRKNPSHPGAHHFYIHIVEASDTPDRGVPSADVLGSLVPAAGHLVHMPAHIYARVGRYEDAAQSNRKAILADENYLASCQAQGIYPMGYYPHNIHFLWMAATLSGQMKEAIDAAEKVADKIPAAAAIEDLSAQNFLSVPLQAYVRFGKWNQILTTPKPASELTWLSMFWHHARSIAFSNKGLFEKAQNEIDTLAVLITKEKDKEKSDSTDMSEEPDTTYNMYDDLHEILQLVPEAELAFAQRTSTKRLND
ncbi:MAG: hypothetical protein IPL46_33490 [Saprospiraceae bacterium]|nr:hypothetical protein [Saprospiraceae bacterium]